MKCGKCGVEMQRAPVTNGMTGKVIDGAFADYCKSCGFCLLDLRGNPDEFERINKLINWPLLSESIGINPFNVHRKPSEPDDS